MASDVFSSKPKSYKIMRKSSLALKLRSSISQKLLEFLHNYTDQVLIDYIIVLVCNGKHQYQARDDLQAFLGDKAAEFVSWLWGFLAEYCDQCRTDDGSRERKDPPGHNSDKLVDKKVCRSSGSDKAEYFSDDHLTTKDVNVIYQSNTTSDAVNVNDNISIEGIGNRFDSEIPSNGMFSEKVVLHNSVNERNARVTPTKNPNDEYVHETPRKAVSSIVVASGGKKPKKVDHGKCNLLSEQHLVIEDKETCSTNLQPSNSASGRPCPEEVNIDNVSRNSPRSASVMPSATQRPRISVWDRLGKPKPSEGIPLGENKQGDEDVVVDASDELVRYPHRSMTHLSNREILPKVMNIGTNINLVEKKTLELGAGETSKPHVLSNIRRKRHFSEDYDAPASVSGSRVNQKNSNIMHKETSRHSKKPKSTLGDSRATSNVVTEVLGVKERLRQMEMEMAKLRSKQLEMKKDGKSNASSHPGNKEHPGGDPDSRTVLVTNVHFSASREALSLYFSQCGVVSNVVIVMDNATGRPKGSACITFSGVESVDKALALSGTTFFSRTIQISRKTEAAALASPSAHTPGRLSQASSSYISTPNSTRPHRLQWRRESSDPTVPSASTSAEKGVNVA